MKIAVLRKVRTGPNFIWAAAHAHVKRQTMNGMKLNNFIGSWKLIVADASLDLGENDEMVLTEDGELLYAIDADSKWQIMKLIYKIENEYLLTDQPSNPNEQKTKYEFENEDILILDYEGALAKYQRIDKCSFSV